MQWVSETGWIEMLAKDSNTISNTSICLQISDEKFADLQESEQRAFIKDVVSLLAVKMLLTTSKDIETLSGFVYGGRDCGIRY